MKLLIVLIIIFAIIVGLILSTSSPPPPLKKKANIVLTPKRKRVAFKRMNTERIYNKKDGSIIGADAKVPFYTRAEAA